MEEKIKKAQEAVWYNTNSEEKYVVILCSLSV